MAQTKYECGNLRIAMEDSLKADLDQRGIMVGEIYRLIESFGNKLLMTKAKGEIDFTNKDTGASLKLDIQWEDEDSAVVHVKELTQNLAAVAMEDAA